MTTTEWKLFQDRVAEMEPLLNRAGARIESPAWLPDKDTGELREVDVLVQLPYASRPVTITIECRKHKAKQDVRWIEQLAQKRQSVGADRTVAVSHSPFTEPAKRKAVQLGIELRTFSELDADELLGEAYSLVFCFEKRNSENLHMEIECGPILDHPGVPVPPLPQELRDALDTRDFQKPVFLDVRTGEKRSLWDIWKTVLWDPIFEGLKPGDPAQRRTLNVRLPDNPPPFRTESDPPVYLWAMRVTADFSLERIDLQPCASYEYRDQSGILLRRLEWDLEPVGQPGTAIIDVYPPEADGGMPLMPRFRQTAGGSARLRLRLEHD